MKPRGEPLSSTGLSTAVVDAPWLDDLAAALDAALDAMEAINGYPRTRWPRHRTGSRDEIPPRVRSLTYLRDNHRGQPAHNCAGCRADQIAAPDPGDRPMTTPDQPTDTAQLRAAVDAAVQANDAALNAIAKQGIQLGGASTFVLGVRLETLAEQLYGNTNDPRRIAYELAVQQRFTAMIADIQSQIARAKLTAGVSSPVPPGLIKPGMPG